jgi:hypothetical protein
LIIIIIFFFEILLLSFGCIFGRICLLTSSSGGGLFPVAAQRDGNSSISERSSRFGLGVLPSVPRARAVPSARPAAAVHSAAPCQPQPSQGARPDARFAQHSVLYNVW